MTTGEKISKCRKERGLTQSELAEVMGVTRQAVSRWESDAAFPETDKLIKLSKLFGCSTDWLLNYNEETFNAGAEPETNEDVKSQRKKFNWNFDLRSLHIEHISKAHIGKLPLVHVNIGIGRTAKGVIAVGFKARGVLSVGILSLGVFAIGILSFGVLALGILSAGIIAAGTFAVGVMAFGAVAIGLLAMGGCAVGLFSLGGYAVGYYVAIGGRAVGGIALGGVSASGSVVSVTVLDMDAAKEDVYAAFEKIPAVWSVFTGWMRSVFEGVLNGSITLGNVRLN